MKCLLDLEEGLIWISNIPAISWLHDLIILNSEKLLPIQDGEHDWVKAKFTIYKHTILTKIIMIGNNKGT